MKAENLEKLRQEAVSNGVTIGEVKTGRRRRTDGVELSWQVTDYSVTVVDGLVPFFIDWGASPHPASSAAKGASLIDLRAEHPDPRGVQQLLNLLGVDLKVARGSSPTLIATIDCQRGRVELL
jgi:hypothetical protein